MDPNIFPDTPSGITPTPPNPTPTLPDDDGGSGDDSVSAASRNSEYRKVYVGRKKSKS